MATRLTRKTVAWGMGGPSEPSPERLTATGEPRRRAHARRRPAPGVAPAAETHWRALSRTSSRGAAHGYGSMSISPGSATRGPIPLGQTNS